MTCISDGKNFKERRKNILFALDSVASEYDNALACAQALAREARAKTYYDELGIITDRIRFYDPDDVHNIVYSAQSLVNRGMPFVAACASTPACASMRTRPSCASTPRRSGSG